MINDNKIKRPEIDKKELVILECITIIIFLVHIMHIKDIGMLFILDDEYGYWGNAAYLSGLDWSDTVSKIPYYSYGYSLLLVPLFWIFDNTIYMYKVAIILNGILLSASFLLCYDIARKLMNNVNRYIIISISFLISMYPTYIAYSHIAWSECFLMFICWLITWCFTNLNEKTSVYKFYLIGFLSGYIYFIHQRAIGILIASVTVIAIMKIFNKINIKQFISVILAIILIMIIGFYLKNNIQSKLWLNGTELSINDYSGQITKINQLLSTGGLVKVLKSFIGKFFYLGAASYLIFYFGLYELINKTWKIIISSIKNKTSSILNTDDKFYVYIFLLLALFLTMAISAIFFINPIGIDEIVYGRYNEMILGPIILIGFVKLMEKKTLSNKLFFLIIIGFCVLTIITDLILKKSDLNIINTNLAHTFGLVLMNTQLGIYLPAIMGIVICRLIWISFSSANIKMIIVTIIVMFSLFFAFGEGEAKSLANQNQDMMKILKVTNIITSTKEDLPVYFLCDDPNNYKTVEWNKRMIRDRSVADCYQFILKDKNIKQVNVEELSNIPGDKFVITTKNIDIYGLMEDFILCGNDEGSFLFKSN